MKTDPSMTKAVLSLARMQYDQNASAENRSIGEFCANILFPLMTERANSNAYKLARRRLLERGRNTPQSL